MADREIYTRVYSARSPRKLVSGKGPTGEPLSSDELLDEFENHMISGQKHPTALVSVSNRIVDTVSRAFVQYGINSRSPTEVWIVFIEIHVAGNRRLARYHRAEDLAREYGLEDAEKFHHEIVFEYAIPEEYVLHRVSLQTLMNRGLDWERYFIRRYRKGYKPPASWTSYLREHIAGRFQPQYPYPWELGLYLGSVSRTFGARAPCGWIAHQLFDDCVQAEMAYHGGVKLKYAHGYSEILRTDYKEFLEERDRGIETALIDWWLGDLRSCPGYEDFEEWRDMMEDCIVSDLEDFCTTWYPQDNPEMFYEPHEVNGLSYDKELEKLLSRRRKIEASIKDEIAKIGL